MSVVGRFASASSSPVNLDEQAGAENAYPKPTINCGTRIDLLAIRRVLPDLWSAFLRQNFRSAYEVQVVFSVTESTSLNWWNGKNAPHASAALAVVHRFPGALQALIGEAA
ncbi:hypothetical protein [Neotabrizicola sp. sgz301269]|uniref:hypothetical protein n=1 Tax=Neotabrizicola sp. sgz301269 TaxID=3276282 RepID=UPI00377024F4